MVKPNGTTGRKKRSRNAIKDVNSDKEEDVTSTRRQRLSDEDYVHQKIAGKIKRLKLRNFMCHSNLEFNFGDRINFLSGKNGSGKSAILTALAIGLGGKTSDTNRGHCLKDLIKNGQSAASIEITLFNENEMAYNKETYGKEITVIRRILEKSSDYKFLSEKGKVITTKRQELLFILSALNIQINNPVCILNQDVARTFFKSTSPAEFYRLFCKGTLLEYINDWYNRYRQERLPVCRANYFKHEKDLQERSKDILELKRKIEKQKELCDCKKEMEAIVNEICWSYIASLENDIKKEEKLIKEYEDSLQQLNKKVSRREVAVKELATQRKALEEDIKTINNENQEIENELLKIESEISKNEETISKKIKEIKRIEEKKAAAVKNCEEIQILIDNQESHAKEVDRMKNEANARRDQLTKKRDELKAVLSTADVHRQQLSDTVNAFNENLSTKSRFLANISNSITYKEQYLKNLQKGMDQLSVYASWMPELIREIKLAHSKGQFEQRPRGPLGSYISVKDKEWAPAIESFLGGKSLRSFCVHSRRDYQMLDSIMERLNIPKKHKPAITISKFIFQVHDISKHETRTSKFRSLFHGLSVADPVVANSIIDQWQVERILLIPTNAEAYPLMENIDNVPINCLRALTKTGDIFFPQPNYKSYSGTVEEQARYLQVNPKQIIKLTEEELRRKREELQKHQKEMKELDVKLKTAGAGLNEAEREVKKLNKQLADCDLKLMELEHQDIPKDYNTHILSEDLKHWKDNISSCEKSIKEIEETKVSVTDITNGLNCQFRELEQKKKDIADKLLETQQKLSSVKEEYSKINDNHYHYTTLFKTEQSKCEAHRKKLAEVSKEYEEAKKSAVETSCDKVENPRNLEILTAKKTDLNRMINALKKIVSVDLIAPADFELRMENFEKSFSFVQFQGDLLKLLEEVLNERVPRRLEEISVTLGCNTDAIFQKILKERHFMGKLEFDHVGKRLNIIIKADPKESKDCPISTLSGGERSFSMVAFIIALWENMKSPFYFLDEFDVFMDEVNRKLVMDLLISIAKSRPEHQYVFLTPHSTVAEDSPHINFFRMEDPRENV